MTTPDHRYRVASLLAVFWMSVGWVSLANAQDSDAASTEKSDPLAAKQIGVAERFARLEELLLRLADVESRENPERAALLKRVARQSREKFVLEKLKQAGPSIASGQLTKALNDQRAATSDLKSLLKLLLSEDRSSRIRDEKKRIEKLIKELRLTQRNERSVRARTENGVDLEEVEKEQEDITRRAEELNRKLEDQNQNDQTDSAQSDDADSADDEAKAGDDRQADKEAQPKEGQPKQNTDQPKQEGKQQEPADRPEDQSSDSQDPSQPADPSQSPPESSESPSQSPEKSAESQPPSQSPPSQSQPSESQESSPPQRPPTPEQQAQQQLQKAIEKMRQAEKKLAEKEREGATKEQREAEEELRQAIDRLEKILRQLREEEIERELAKLESRLRKMSAMQAAVLDATVQLAKTPAPQRNRATDLKAGDLSFEEQKITLEADRAMLLLQEEGSSVAFPEVVLQLREDTKRVATRLGQTKIDLVTQGIQSDILAALEEMIEALAKARRDHEKKQQNQQQGKPSGQGSGEEPLVQALAELKLIRTMQTRIQGTTDRYAELIGNQETGDNATNQDVLPLLKNLSKRQDRLYQITRDLVTKRNQ